VAVAEAPVVAEGWGLVLSTDVNEAEKPEEVTLWSVANRMVMTPPVDRYKVWVRDPPLTDASMGELVLGPSNIVT